MKRMFRLLKKDEIDCRVSTVKQNGCSLLLYKDARCDMNILDETVSPYNWQRSHSRDNANCIVSIWDTSKSIWISKEDTGTESFTEKEKGLASDSFKRACFNWGIGRELYTAPFIWISLDPSETFKKGDKYSTYAKFFVDQIKYNEDGTIESVVIIDKDKKVRSGKSYTKTEPVKKSTPGLNAKKAKMIALAKDKLDLNDIVKKYGVKLLGQLTEVQIDETIKTLEATE